MLRKINNICRLVVLLSLLVAVGIPFLARAQVDNIVSNDIKLSVSPGYPGPHDTIRVEANSFSFNTELASFTWRVNGVVAGSGVGVKSITSTVGRIGAPTIVSVQANSTDERRYEQSITIWPTSLDLLWHTTTYTPPGYRGKALPIRGAVVTVVALPSFAGKNGIISPKTLIYEWKVDGALLTNVSGRGKSTLSVPIAKSKNVPPAVSVRVSDETNTVVQQKFITIPIFEPLIMFYELHPLQGPLFQSAFSSTRTLDAGNEIQILAVPYFAGTSPEFLNFKWRIDADYLPPDEKTPNVLSYKSEPGSVVNQTIVLEVTNPFYILEQIQKSFRFTVK